jgi:hypothetical protein
MLQQKSRLVIPELQDVLYITVQWRHPSSVCAILKSMLSAAVPMNLVNFFNHADVITTRAFFTVSWPVCTLTSDVAITNTHSTIATVALLVSFFPAGSANLGGILLFLASFSFSPAPLSFVLALPFPTTKIIKQQLQT